MNINVRKVNKMGNGLKGIKGLQNGSDVRGVAIEGVPGESVNLTPEAVEKIGYAFTIWLSETLNKDIKSLKIGVGHDSRLSADMVKTALFSGLSAKGCKIMDCGLASTPAMFMTTVEEGFEYDGGIMITASHLPFNRNGMKFFTKNGGLEKADIKALLEIAEVYELSDNKEDVDVEEVDFMSTYSASLVDKIRTRVNLKDGYDNPLAGLKIIVDAGNGAGGFFVDKVLKPLGADTSGSQFLDPDGNFPNHIPNPENKEAMASIQKAVLDNKADLGIIFDTDVDRSAIVDNLGKAINSNSFIALIAAILLETYPGSTIVTDSITSTGLAKFIENELGGVHHRFKRGYKNVINESIRLNEEGVESCLAMETSGHGAVKDNYFLDDGAYLAAMVLIKLAQLKHEKNLQITSLISKLEVPAFSSELRVGIYVEDFGNYGAGVLEQAAAYADSIEGWSVVPKSYEGIKIDINNGEGWILIRQSLHDPCLPINIELNDPSKEKEVLGLLTAYLNKFDALVIPNTAK